MILSCQLPGQCEREVDRQQIDRVFCSIVRLLREAPLRIIVEQADANGVREILPVAFLEICRKTYEFGLRGFIDGNAREISNCIVRSDRIACERSQRRPAQPYASASLT